MPTQAWDQYQRQRQPQCARFAERLLSIQRQQRGRKERDTNGDGKRRNELGDGPLHGCTCRILDAFVVDLSHDGSVIS
jgi:hypothetical protein